MMRLLRFKPYQFHLGRTHYILLPKLNPDQMQILSERLTKMGELVTSNSLLSARTQKGTVHVDSSGLCWSRVDPADLILPSIPDLLSCAKLRIPLKELGSKYFVASRYGGITSTRLFIRLESGPLWKALRASGGCALTPDEHKVAIHLMNSVGGRCEITTDFPTSRSTERTFGQRHYFDSVLESSEAALALRISGRKDARNAYLPQNAVLRFRGQANLRPRGIRELLNGLGDWCFFFSE